MPLPLPVPREEMHLRELQIRGYRRNDGFFDIEGHLTDRKTHPLELNGGRIVAAYEPIHDMMVRLTLDMDCKVLDAIASSDATPFAVCPNAAASLECIVGLYVGPGWRHELRSRLGGKRGCTHLLEILVSLGTVAVQTVTPFLQDRPVPIDIGGRPRQIDSCLAYASDGEVVALLWPQNYTGQRQGS